MDSELPSYASAVSRDPWTHISEYVRQTDLPAASLVCKQWNEVFQPIVWGKLLISSDKQDEEQRAPLARLIHVIRIARSSTRRLTHTVQLDSAPGLYDNFDSEWLRTIFEGLPNLQSLLLHGLTIVDHQSLAFLQRRATQGQGSSHTQREYPLKMLVITSCPNVSATDLHMLLSKLPNLVYLDMSYTRAAGYSWLLEGLKVHPRLQVLKVRGLNMHHSAIESIAGTIGRQAFSLDLGCNSTLSNNFNLSHAVPSLVDDCFIDTTQRPEIIRQNIATLDGEWPTSDRIAILTSSYPFLKDQRHDEYIQRILTSHFVEATGAEIFLNTGICHLKISDRTIGSVQIAKILSSKSLWSLDVDYMWQMWREGSRIEMLTALQKCGGSLTYLRINHNIVTGFHGERPFLRFSSKAPSDPPDLIESHGPAALVSPLYTADPSPTTYSSSSNYLDVTTGYQRYLDSRSESGYLDPWTLPHLRTLALTRISDSKTSLPVADRIIAFIKACALERWWAMRRAQVDYTLPPGRRKEGLVKLQARTLFPLRTIVLEVVEPAPPKRSQETSWSSVEDPDCENLWYAAQDDFSFFDEQIKVDESTTLHADVIRRANPTDGSKISHTLKNTNPGQDSDRVRASTSGPPQDGVITDIARFRQEARAKYADAAEFGHEDVLIQGHWDGEVKVIRVKG